MKRETTPSVNYYLRLSVILVILGYYMIIVFTNYAIKTFRRNGTYSSLALQLNNMPMNCNATIL